MLITGKCSWRCPSKGIMAASCSEGHRCICQRRGPYITSQGGPFCLAVPFLWIQQECSLQNLAPVAWHLVKLIHRQETNCQIKWVSSSLPLPSRLACGQDNTAYLPLSRHTSAKCPLLSCARKRETRRRANYCKRHLNHLLGTYVRMRQGTFCHTHLRYL